MSKPECPACDSTLVFGHNFGETQGEWQCWDCHQVFMEGETFSEYHRELAKKGLPKREGPKYDWREVCHHGHTYRCFCEKCLGEECFEIAKEGGSGE